VVIVQGSGSAGWARAARVGHGRALVMPEVSTTRAALLVALLALLPYANALRADFTLDDQPQIRDNAVVTGGADIVQTLATPLFPGDLYRPLTILSFALNEAVMPGAAAPFHAVNLGLHAGVTVLVFAVALRLFGDVRIAALAGALFAVHPIHTEAVTSIVGRAELFAALFGLLALLTAAISDAATSRFSRTTWQTVSTIAFALALLSKESALTVLPLIVLFRIACRGEPLRRGLWRELRQLDWLAYALCAGLFIVLRYYVVGAVAPPLPIKPLNNPLAFVPWTVRLPSALGVLWDYFALLTVPVVLAADYSYNQVPVVASWLAPRVIAGVAVVGGAVWLAARHPRAGVRFAAAFPLIAIMLTANVFFAIGTIKAERLLYFPSVGWVILAAYALNGIMARERYRVIGMAVAGAIVIAFGARTWIRNWDWQDNLALYRSIAASAPDSAKARHDLGVVLQRDGRHAAAIAQFRSALAVYPYPESAFGIALSYERQSRIDEAVEWYRRALSINPDFGKAHTNLCHLLFSSERFDAANTACRNGLRYAPADSNLLRLLGLTLVRLGDTQHGTAVLHRALAAGGSDPELESYLAELGSAGSRAAARADESTATAPRRRDGAAP
jgi:protein O-mannosyl-transferase